MVRARARSGRDGRPVGRRTARRSPIDPDFARSGFFYAVYTTSEGFRVARFHEIGDVFAERVVMLDGIAASTSPAAALRFGPDARLYVGFDDGGVAARAGDFGSYNGKVLRINADGSVPSDQTGLTPVWATNVAAPRALDWTAGMGRCGPSKVAPRAPAGWTPSSPMVCAAAVGKIASQYALPDRADPSGVVAYHGDLIQRVARRSAGQSRRDTGVAPSPPRHVPRHPGGADRARAQRRSGGHPRTGGFADRFHLPGE